MLYQIEYTDTFGGEANYSWVKRASFIAPDNASSRMLVKRAKFVFGVTGRHDTDDFGDEIVIRPRGTCTIIFIRPEPEHGDARDYLV